MVQIVAGNSLDFRAAAYGQIDPATVALVRSSTEALVQAFGAEQNMHTQRIAQMAEDYAGNATLDLMRGALAKIRHAFLPDVVMHLHERDMLQQAPTIMRYAIMSDPVVLEQYRAQRIEGYGDHFTDLFPDQSGYDHPVYQSVHHGIIQEPDEDDEEGGDSLRVWLRGDDEEQAFTLAEQHDILLTQAQVREDIIHGSHDPTSEWNARLR